MRYSFVQIVSIIKGEWLQQAAPAEIEHLLLDSRKLLFPSSSVFFALSGPRRHGNSFIAELYEKGVRNFVVDESFEKEGWSGDHTQANIVVVKDVLHALQLLAVSHRSQFNIPVIGITGSNGKTIVKEWLYQLLQDDATIVRSPKSYNSQIGVPLSVWQMNEADTLGIFEAGISQPGEMERLEPIIAPTIGIFTNIGEAHSEGFRDVHQKMNEKLKLFAHADVLIYHADDKIIHEAVAFFKDNVNKGLQLFSWGSGPGVDVQVTSIKKQIDATDITINYQLSTFNFRIPFADDASIEDAISCVCALLQICVPVNIIEGRMAQLRQVEMRLELKQGINNCSVINDSYSVDMSALTIALDFLQQQQQHTKRTLILSDILQSGKNSVDLYVDVAFILQQKKIDRLIGIGPELTKAKDTFAAIPETAFFSSTIEFKQQFYSLHFGNESILLKGARIFEFEQLAHLLEQKIHQTVLEINLNAIGHNLKIYQQELNSGVKMMAMVKAFSYGSGSFEVANLLQFHKVDHLAVAYADEGVELRKAGITLPIMVMNAEETTFDVLLYHDLEPELYSFAILNAFEKYLQRSGITNYPVHIKLDTGMRRLGFEVYDSETLAEKLRSTDVFKVQSVFSHLAGSDTMAHDGFTQQQAASFFKSCNILEQAIPYPFLKHIANTSAIHRHKELQLDMVRLGIGLYGVDSAPSMQRQLRNVSTLKTTISQIKKISIGESVGYSRKGTVVRDSVIATVRIGYADGYPRLLSDGVGKMWLNGHLVPVIGNVCMDMTMLDITGVPAEEGDDVIVFGEQLPVADVAKWSQTIAYEILTGISQRVNRVYFEE